MRTLILGIVAIAALGCATPRRTPIWDAASEGRTNEVALLLAQGGPINEWTSGTTALGIAAKNGHAETVKLLLERGADIEADPAGFGMTPLSFAAMARRPNTLEILVAKGANIQSALDGLVRTAEANRPYITTSHANLEAFNETSAGAERLRRLLDKGDSPINSSGAALASTTRPVSAPVLAPNFSGESQWDYAVVIGIENYADLPPATFAERDATAVRRFVAALGVPERNIMTLTGGRATRTGIEKTVEAWLPNNVSEDSRVFFFYSGHGAPDTKTGDAYLVPLDGDPQYLAHTGYPLKRLYAKLGELKAKKVVVALDSCFSGAGGRSVLAKGTRPLVGKVDLSVGAASKRIEVLSASGADQISGANDEAGYGLFTYNLLKGLNGEAKDASGKITVRSLYDYVRPRVADQARRANRDQTPQLQAEGEGAVLREK